MKLLYKDESLPREEEEDYKIVGKCHNIEIIGIAE